MFPSVMQCQRWVCTNPLLLPMDDTSDITLDQRYADVWCEWAFRDEPKVAAAFAALRDLIRTWWRRSWSCTCSRARPRRRIHMYRRTDTSTRRTLPRPTRPLHQQPTHIIYVNTWHRLKERQNIFVVLSLLCVPNTKISCSRESFLLRERRPARTAQGVLVLQCTLQTNLRCSSINYSLWLALGAIKSEI